MVAVSPYELRAMTEADISQVAAIERESFPSIWPQTAYKRELTNRLARYLVVVDRSQAAPAVEPSKRSRWWPFRRRQQQAPTTSDFIVAYVGVWLMVDETHIVAIAVRPAYRRRGLGELLLQEIIDLALASDQETVTLEVRRSNLAAQTLYEKYRFLKVGVRRRYYTDNGEDAIVMSTPPIRGGSYQELLAYLKEQHARRWAAGGGETGASSEEGAAAAEA